MHSRREPRRALEQARRPSRAVAWGSPRLAELLRRALDVSRSPADAVRELTHGFHTYPARMHPHTARRALAALGVGPGATVVDPFCGSGTVLVEGYRAGARSVGMDINPLAVEIARTRCFDGPAARRRALVVVARRIGAEVVAAGKAARRSGYEASPPPAEPARARQLTGWFDPHVRRELEALSAAIRAERDRELARVLLVVLSSILIKVSRRESDTSERPLARQVGRGAPARLFAARAEELVRGLDALGREAPRDTLPVTVLAGDARRFEDLGLAPGSASVVVTSPPYAGTYDYAEQHALRIAFLGLAAKAFQEGEIGARRGFRGGSEQVAAALARWDRDLGRALATIARVLAPGGHAALLLGDSLAGDGAEAGSGAAVFAVDVVRRLASAVGLRVVAGASQERAALGGAERAAFAQRPKEEHLIVLARG